MPIKTFRGQIPDSGTQVLSLHTNNGAMGYRIKKFSLMAIDPIGNNQESVVLVWSMPTAATDKIDFSDQRLLAAGYLESDNSGATPTFNEAAIIFDNMTFNQDVYITHIEQGSDAVNYYIEMEQVKLDLNENTVATLKDIRNTTQ